MGGPVSELRDLYENIGRAIDTLDEILGTVRRGAAVDDQDLTAAVDLVATASTSFRARMDDAAGRLGIARPLAAEGFDEFERRVADLESRDIARLNGIVGYLRVAHVVCGRSFRRVRLEALREGAVEELSAAAGAATLLEGPTDGAEWFAWWWLAPETSADPLLKRLEATTPRFVDLLTTATQPELTARNGSAEAGPVGGERPPAAPAADIVSTTTIDPPDGTAPRPPPTPVADAPSPPHRAQSTILWAALATTNADLAPSDVGAEAFDPRPAKAERGGEPTPPMRIGSAAPGASRSAPGSDIKRDRPAVERTPPVAALPTPRAVPAPSSVAGRHMVEVPDDVRQFALFAARHWISPSGELQLAPWTTTGFIEGVRRGLHAAIVDGDLPRAWIFARCVANAGGTPEVHPDEIHGAATILAHGPRAEAGSLDRNERLRRSLAEVSPQIRVALTLAALRPSEDSLPPNKVAHAVEVAAFGDPALAKVIGALLRLASTGRSPIEALVDAHRTGAQPTVPELQTELQQARDRLSVVFRERYSAAGGGVQRTHCREAWTEFITKLRLQIQPLLAGPMNWIATDLDTVIRRIPRLHAKYADDYDAKYGDRRKMDRAAAEIADVAGEVNAIYRRFQTAQKAYAIATHDEPFPTTEVRGLLERRLDDPIDDLCRRLLQRIIRTSASNPPVSAGATPLGLPLAVLIRWPAFLTCLEAADIAALPREMQRDDVVVAANTVMDTRHSAAILLEAAAPEAVPPDPGLLDVPTSLEAAVRAVGRQDLTGYLLPLLRDRGREQARRWWDDFVQSIQDLVSRIEDKWRRLEDLAHNESDWLRSVAADAKKQMEAGQGAPPPELRLVQEWLGEVERAADALREESERGLLTKAAGRPELEEQVREAIKGGRYAEALLLVGGSGRALSPQERGTPWRHLAEEIIPNPRSALEETPRLPKASTALVSAWRQPAGVGEIRQPSRKRLAELFMTCMFGDLEARTDDEGVVWVSALAVRRRLADRRLNPTFVPQLSGWSHVLVLVAPLSVTGVQYPLKAAQAAAAAPYQNALVLVLAPGITGDARAKTLALFQQRGVRAAVIDDLDLARIVLPEPDATTATDPMIATIEVALEQQAIKAIDPFGGHEGQHVKMEMYVGRRDEAEQLAKTSRFSRLFSGRKLGKSALLRYVEEAVDKQLPSGNHLHVVYVPVVGIDSEDGFVQRVLEHVRDRFGIPLPPPTEPGDRLVEALRDLLKARPNDSVLFVLDEADVFVEGQLEEYERLKERCLTFRMRTEIEAIRDVHQFPRVRFVFSGYRATHTNEGAWANWGDVLVLSPLDQADAQKLIAGPLARLGVDGSAQAASIAYRCGYQPAVILRFGHVLIQELEQRRTRAPGRRLEVDAAMVARTFNHSSVQEEIVTVVQNNFKGNEAAHVVFNAILIEFESRPPGSDIPDLADLVVARLDEIAAGAAWRPRDAASSRGHVEMVLRDLVNRSLLGEERIGTSSTYRLKFPHHLPILMRRDPAAQIRSTIAALAGRDPLRATDRVRGLLPKSDMEELREHARGANAEFGVAAVVLSSMWPESFNHPHGGLAVRLGLAAAGELSGGDVIPSVLTGATPEVAKEVVERWRRGPKREAAVLVGDEALLRWAIGWSGEEIVERLAPGRLSRTVLDWWFTRVRGIEFPDAEVMAKIVDKTGGIPPFVALMDAILVSYGDTPLPNEIGEVFVRFETGFDECARGVLARLERREREVLDTIVRASDAANTGDRIVDALDLVDGDLGYPTVTEADEGAFEVLLHLGLVPATSVAGLPRERILRVEDADPIRRVPAVE